MYSEKNFPKHINDSASGGVVIGKPDRIIRLFQPIVRVTVQN